MLLTWSSFVKVFFHLLPCPVVFRAVVKHTLSEIYSLLAGACYGFTKSGNIACQGTLITLDHFLLHSGTLGQLAHFSEPLCLLVDVRDACHGAGVSL